MNSPPFLNGFLPNRKPKRGHIGSGQSLTPSKGFPESLFLLSHPKDTQNKRGELLLLVLWTFWESILPRACQWHYSHGLWNPPLEIFVQLTFDEFVKSQKSPVFVIPAKAGIQGNQSLLDSRFRGSDGLGDFLRDHQHLDSLTERKKGSQGIFCFPLEPFFCNMPLILNGIILEFRL